MDDKKKKYEIDFFALQILVYMEQFGYSPSCIFAQKLLIKNAYGKDVSLRGAYRRVKNQVDYLDDELLEKINSYPCIKSKLKKSNVKKDCNNE